MSDPDPLDQLPPKVARALRNAKLQPYRINTATDLRVFFRDLADAERAAGILKKMSYGVDVLPDLKRKDGWEVHAKGP